ncbi:kinase-like protein [Pseudohyphozyma bogoriensis]|nr:kinase-like protein [Pseudohyphozyma bogoriensis]
MKHLKKMLGSNSGSSAPQASQSAQSLPSPPASLGKPESSDQRSRRGNSRPAGFALPKRGDRAIVLGKGARGVVYLVQDSEGAFYAGKFTRRSSSGNSLLDNEYRICQKLRHAYPPSGASQHVTKCFGQSSDSKGTWLFMELAYGGSLLEYLEEVARQEVELSEEAIAEIGRQLFSGLGFLHSVGIAHRDVKTNNAMLLWPIYDTARIESKRTAPEQLQEMRTQLASYFQPSNGGTAGIIKMADFDSACDLSPGAQNIGGLLNTPGCTPPEALQRYWILQKLSRSDFDNTHRWTADDVFRGGCILLSIVGRYYHPGTRKKFGFWGSYDQLTPLWGNAYTHLDRPKYSEAILQCMAMALGTSASAPSQTSGTNIITVETADSVQYSVPVYGREHQLIIGFPYGTKERLWTTHQQAVRFEYWERASAYDVSHLCR